MPISFDDRRKGFESKWAHDAELRFQVEARRDRLVGAWAAAEKGLAGAEADSFVSGVIAAGMQANCAPNWTRTNIRTRCSGPRWPTASTRQRRKS